MRQLSSILLAAVFVAGHTSAQSASREATIEHIEALTFGQTNVYTPDSPIVALLITEAKAANPAEPQSTWDSIKAELATALAKAMTENGGPMRGVLSGALDSMSDAELNRLANMLDDPAYRKFQAALSTPSLQRRIMAASGANGARMQSALNTVLAKHGLKQAH
jgi:hypothetical protein